MLYSELFFNLHFSLARPKNLGRTRSAASAMPHAYTTMIAVRFGSERINNLFNVIIINSGPDLDKNNMQDPAVDELTKSWTE